MQDWDHQNHRFFFRGKKYGYPLRIMLKDENKQKVIFGFEYRDDNYTNPVFGAITHNKKGKSDKTTKLYYENLKDKEFNFMKENESFIGNSERFIAGLTETFTQSCLFDSDQIWKDNQLDHISLATWIWDIFEKNRQKVVKANKELNNKKLN